MLYDGKTKIGRIFIGKEVAASLWRGAVKVWEAISSCFGSGWWRSEDSWGNEDSWVN